MSLAVRPVNHPPRALERRKACLSGDRARSSGVPALATVPSGVPALATKDETLSSELSLAKRRFALPCPPVLARRELVAPRSFLRPPGEEERKRANGTPAPPLPWRVCVDMVVACGGAEAGIDAAGSSVLDLGGIMRTWSGADVSSVAVALSLLDAGCQEAREPFDLRAAVGWVGSFFLSLRGPALAVMTGDRGPSGECPVDAASRPVSASTAPADDEVEADAAVGTAEALLGARTKVGLAVLVAGDDGLVSASAARRTSDSGEVSSGDFMGEVADGER